MKRVFKKGIALVLALILCFATAGSALAAGFGLVSSTNSLNLRAAASVSSQWLGAYPRGSWVEIIGSQNNFYHVIAPDGRVGYMSKNYITTDGNALKTVRIAIVNNANGGAYLNFRTAPSYTAAIHGVLYNGTPLLVLGEQNGWYYVQLNGKNGYVRSEYVKVDYMVGSSEVATIKTNNGGALNLRVGPGTQYAVLRQFPNNQHVMVLAKGNGWWLVAVNGYTGYMDQSYLKTGLVPAQEPVTNVGGSTGSSTGSTSNNFARPYAVVNNPKPTQALNLRQCPTTAASVLRKLYNGTELLVTDYGTEWCAVTLKDTGISGYVMTKYITLLNMPSLAFRTVVHPSGSYVNLRQGQSLSSAVLMRVPHGQQVSVLSVGTDWCKVSYNGIEGYMLNCFLK